MDSKTKSQYLLDLSKTVAGAGIIGIILKDVASNQKYIFVGGLVVVFIVLVVMAFKISKKQ